MKTFFHVSDIGDLGAALEEAKQVKATPYAWKHLGENKTIMLVFFNSSLRTRLSSQKAAINLGMSPIVLNIGQDSWKLETEMGVVMDGDKSEHLREAIPVMTSYCDLIGIRSFAGLTDRGFDYNETVLKQFIEYGGKPVISLESATVPRRRPHHAKLHSVRSARGCRLPTRCSGFRRTSGCLRGRTRDGARS